MGAPNKIVDLVDYFSDNIAAIRSAGYKETQARRELIDPFFAALGWDVANEQHIPEAFKDVIHEDSLKIGGLAQAPDYSFRVGGERRFFVEAKKPSVNLRSDPHSAYQLRRYAWSANLPLSILTDFEEFIVYDCRLRPDKTDKADTARIFYLTYRDYAEQWDQIASRFSRQAVLDGSLDAFVESLRTKKGIATVDAAFLKEIESWRDQLAHNIALRNPGLTQRDLNYAVQMTIDRIIFLRMAEDRGIEEYERLKRLADGEYVYERLLQLFVQADARYNSGLFYFQPEKGRIEQPDTLSPKLKIDDDVLRHILRNLYYPESPYEFSVLPIETLGHVYEQFLGKVIHLTPEHRAVVQEKPEVRKAGGVYYTPTYIVDYIVEHTVGKLVEDKTPRQVAGAGKTPPLRVVDPACGSGSFLIGAYQYLLDWYRERYVQEGPEKHKKILYQTKGGEWRLTTAERKRILVDHIFGVDIDAQAVEVTKLSLLLKVLEGENRETLVQQLALFHERALPDLSRNIRCGNSLIGPDFYDGMQLGLLGDEERYRLNIFDWKAAFPQVFQADDPGFDVVIGNPPYIRIQALQEWAPLEVEFYKRAYQSASKGNYDIYVVFVEKGLTLLSERGRLGFILPHKFLNAQYGEPLRKSLAEGHNLAKVVHFGDQQVFANATTYTCLMFLEKGGRKEFQFVKAHDLADWRLSEVPSPRSIPAEQLTSAPWLFSESVSDLRSHTVPLQDFAHVFQGLATSADSVYVLEIIDRSGTTWKVRSKALEGETIEIESSLLHPLLKGSEITRYVQPSYQQVVLFPYRIQDDKAEVLTEGELKKNYPLAYNYFGRTEPILLARSKVDASVYWHFPYPKNLTLYEKPKILVQVLSTRANFTLDGSGQFYFLGGGTAGGNAVRPRADHPESPLYLLGILNSSFCTTHVRRVGSPFRGGYFAFGKSSIGTLPIRTIDFTNRGDVAQHDRMVAMVEEMLRLHKRVVEVQNPHEKSTITAQITALDKQIDRLVYELYELTDEEISIVENASNAQPH